MSDLHTKDKYVLENSANMTVSADGATTEKGD